MTLFSRAVDVLLQRPYSNLAFSLHTGLPARVSGYPVAVTSAALLFERDRVDEVDDWSHVVDHIGRKSILWIDLDRSEAQEIRHLGELLELSSETTTRLESDDGQPYFGDFKSYLHTTAFAPTKQDGDAEPAKVDCLVAKQWVVTVRDGDLEVFDEFRARMTESSGEVGLLDGPEFLAGLLEWTLEAYLGAFEAVELALEEFDERVMQGHHHDAEDELARLVAHRKHIGRLRRALVSHRSMFLALARPELEAITNSEHADHFHTLRGQLEEVVQVARDSREAVFGSFDVLIARSERRTNEIMKLLTLGTFIFLPGALLAGVMGMNFKVSFFETTAYFWIVCAVIVAIAVSAFTFARVRRWI
jgi:magnesium transporter